MMGKSAQDQINKASKGMIYKYKLYLALLRGFQNTFSRCKKINCGWINYISNKSKGGVGLRL